MAELAKKVVVDIWHVLEEYIQTNPDFATSLVPVEIQNGAPGEVIEMARAAARANVGPMAAVAGLFSERVGKALINSFPVNELVVENGGDIFLKLKNDLIMSVFAGNSPLSEKLGVKIPAEETPVGVCTSSGTIGPSLSFGMADAVMVACRSTALADAFATSFGNKVKSPGVIGDVLKNSEDYPEILSMIIICRDKTGIRGNFELKLI